MNQKRSGQIPARCTKVSVIEETVVTDENLAEVLGVTAFEQHPSISLGDVISVHFFYNNSVKNSGTVTIWHNRRQAAIKTYSASLHGEWLESESLIVSDDQDDAWT